MRARAVVCGHLFVHADDGLAWVRAGGNIDFTSDHALTPSALSQYYKAGGDTALDHVLVSSDAYGSWPTFDAIGNVLSYSYSKPDGLLRTLQTMVSPQACHSAVFVRVPSS